MPTRWASLQAPPSLSEPRSARERPPSPERGSPARGTDGIVYCSLRLVAQGDRPLDRVLQPLVGFSGRDEVVGRIGRLTVLERLAGILERGLQVTCGRRGWLGRLLGSLGVGRCLGIHLGQRRVDVTITRAVIKIRSVRWRTEGKIGYLRITSFSEQTSDGLGLAMKKIKEKLEAELLGVVLDLRKPEARPVFERLVNRADVVIHNMRDPAARKLGLTFEDLRQINEGIVLCAILGFDRGGPYSDRPAYDDLIQGLVALPDLMRRSGGENQYVPLAVADRIAVIFDGRIVGILSREEASVSLIGQMMTGMNKNGTEHYSGKS